MHRDDAPAEQPDPLAGNAGTPSPGTHARRLSLPGLEHLADDVVEGVAGPGAAAPDVSVPDWRRLVPGVELPEHCRAVWVDRATLAVPRNLVPAAPGGSRRTGTRHQRGGDAWLLVWSPRRPAHRRWAARG